ncbi:MAG: HAD family hydrolase [Proteobacteria bacterium]|nr:MAG: HAD family hydrolase [Pseudomonadota bacterium]
MLAVDHSTPESRLIASVRKLCSPLDPIPSGIEPNIPELHGIRAVLFDVYGTLFVSHSGDIGTTSSEACETSFRQALAACGITSNDTEVPLYISRFGELNREQREALHQEGIDFPEMDVVEIWQQLLGELMASHRIRLPQWGADRPEALIRQLAVEYEYRLNPAWPMPGLESTLDSLHLGGIKYGIISNAQFYSPLLFTALAGKSSKELGFQESLVIWSYEHRAVKPSAILFEQASDRLEFIHGISANETLFVGNDKLKDVWAASQHGMKTALFAGDSRSLRLHESDQRCTGFTPDLTITDLTQLVDSLGLPHSY